MNKEKKINPKYYLIADDSILQLLNSLNNANERHQRVYNRELHIQQIIEPIGAPGEYFAICYDTVLPPKVDYTIRPNFDPLVDWLRKKLTDEAAATDGAG